MGGMGAITQALAASGQKLGVEIRTSAPVAHIDVRDGRARGVVLEDGTEIRARMESAELLRPIASAFITFPYVSPSWNS